MKCGQIVSCKIKKLEDYGLYLECEGETVFVTLTNISWVEGPLEKEKYKPGNIFDVKITKYSEKSRRGVHYLGSIKDACPELNPWLKHNYACGDVFDGMVINVAEYGVVVRLNTGVLGLIPEIELQEGKSVNQMIKVMISEIDVEKKRLLLKEV